MNIRNQVAKLRQQSGLTQFNRDVREISALMDELHAAATGGDSPENASLLEILSEASDQSRPNRGQTIKR
ncbi:MULTISPECIES: hypothetical protein [Pseudomonas]|jgi:hypothetical protein|uniref:Uncharacterized protein n=1 Tax=Pseudomonas canadensis TaxID=915099 RepID=A0ABZ1A6H7_9PSED|nr:MULTISPECIES: hypothetical protein [Pseudomonas]NMX62792.1 hypothetical protein [Pseudomonas sp. WS 5079]WRI23603.1 hypothetical protein SPL95_23775 [Pseudomonas canadensis]